MGRLFKEMFIIFLGVASFLYLIYPSLGIFELIPDYIPLVGSIDEGTATLLLISVFRYYGLDLSRLFGKRTDDQGHPLVPQARQTYRPESVQPSTSVQGENPAQRSRH